MKKIYAVTSLILLTPNLSYADDKSAIESYLKTPDGQKALREILIQQKPDLLKSIFTSSEGQSALATALADPKNLNKIMNNLKNDNAFQKEHENLVKQAQYLQTEKITQIESQFDSFMGDKNQSFLLNTLVPIAKKQAANTKVGGEIKAYSETFDRHVYFSTTAGYQWSPSATKKQQESLYDFSQQDNLVTNFALGIYIKNHPRDNAFKQAAAQKLREKNEQLKDAVDAVNADIRKLSGTNYFTTIGGNTFTAHNHNLDKASNHLKEIKLAKANKSLTISISEEDIDSLQKNLTLATEKKEESEKYYHEVTSSYRRGFAIQGEYNEIRAKVSSTDEILADQKSAQKNISVVGLVPILPKTWAEAAYENYDTHVYGIIGAGYTTLKASENQDAMEEENRDIRSKTIEDSLGIIGLGYSKGIKNSKTQIIGEIRAVYNVKDNYWQPQAMAGIRVGLAQYASKYLP